MSASQRVAPAAPARTRPATAPRMPRLVAPRRIPRASAGTFALLVGGFLTLGLLGLLALNTLLAQGSFATHELTQQRAALTVREQALQQEVAVLESPQELARRAGELGMVTSENPVFLDLKTKKILGTAKAGVRPPAAMVPSAPAASLVAAAPATPRATPTATPTAGAKR